jgi:hypothetical protein
MLDGMALKTEAILIIQTMKNNSPKIMEMDKKHDNPFCQLWLTNFDLEHGLNV